MHKIGRLGAYTIMAAALLIQLTFLGRFRIFGAEPDLMLLCVTFFGLFLGPAAGLETGAVAGAMMDIFSLDYFGINTFVYTATGLLSGALNTSFVRESRRTQALIVFFCTAFSMCLHFFLASVFSGSVELGFYEYLRACVIPAGLYTAAVSIPVFAKLSGVYNLREREDLL
jgi:rod shape-determining protein MreD